MTYDPTIGYRSAEPRTRYVDIVPIEDIAHSVDLKHLRFSKILRRNLTAMKRRTDAVMSKDYPPLEAGPLDEEHGLIWDASEGFEFLLQILQSYETAIEEKVRYRAEDARQAQLAFGRCAGHAD